MYKEGRGREGKEDSIVGGNHPGTLISTDIKILEIGFASKREVKAYKENIEKTCKTEKNRAKRQL